MSFAIKDMLFTHPPILYYEVEDRCNMSCSMCITQSHRKSRYERLTLAEIKNLLLARFRFAGGRFMMLSGGEPTLSNDLEEILAYSARIGLFILLSTNLYRIDNDRMKNILKMLPDKHHHIVVSYDSVHPEEMKAIRGVDAHRMVTANLKSLLQIKKELGVKTRITANVTLQERNCRSIAETITFLRKLDSKVFIAPVNLYTEINEETFSQATPSCSREALPALLAAVETVFQMANKERHVGLCHPDIDRWRRHFSAPTAQKHACMSSRHIFVSRHGDYRGCPHSRAYDNIRNIGIRDFLKSETYGEHLRLAAKCNICTHECS